MHISTVRIRSVETASGFIVINEADFDPSKHQLWNSEVTTATPEPSSAVKARVDAARSVQAERFAGTEVVCNAHMTPAMVGRFCALDDAGERILKGAFDRMGLTARSHDRILRVARTIADLEGEERISASHLAEAVQYRNTDILKG